MTLPVGHGLDLDALFQRTMAEGKPDATLGELGERWDRDRTLAFCLFDNQRQDLLFPLLEAQYDSLTDSKLGRELLDYAIYRLDRGVARYLVTAGVPLKKDCLFSIIHRNEAWSFARFLLDLGADPTFVNDSGNSLLHAQAHYRMWNGEDWIRPLLEYGVLLERRNRGGFTALQEACLCLNVSISRSLIAVGADKNVLTENGATLLHLACYGISAADIDLRQQHYRMELVQLLLAEGLDPNTPNADGKTPRDFARHFGHTNLEKVFVAARGSLSVE